VTFDFDPVGTILGFAVRWQIVAVAATILLALLLAAVIARAADRRRAEALAADPDRAAAVAEAVEAALETVRATGAAEPPAPVPQDAPSLVDHPWLVSLRLDDLLFIVIAGAAGAVVGGRLGYALLYLDVYRLDPSAILDPSRGSLTLAGGVALGVITGLLVATILGAPVRRWLGVAVVPLLLALCLGKLAMVLGGAGQGLPADAGWATAYAGPGPWGSLAPHIPSIPAQAIEAATSAAALAAVLLLALLAPLRRHAAVLFAAGLGLWALGRFAVAFTWRDPTLVGPLNGDQLVTLAIAVAAAASVVGGTASIRRGRTTLATAETVPPVGAEVAVEAPTPPPLDPGAPWPPGRGYRQEVD
jgi:phosphatidylglycerol:prolipoprotein diacylglycerol transferase